MSEDPSQSKRNQRKRKVSRRLSFHSRVRDRIRRGADRVLAADPMWSALLIAVAMLVLGGQRCGNSFADFKEGEPAPRTVRAQTDLEVVDRVLTEQRRTQAAAAVPETYVHDVDRAEKLAEELRAVFTEGREMISAGPTDAAAIAERMGDRLPEPILSVLVRRGFSAEIEQILVPALRRVMRGLVIGNKGILEREPAIRLVRVPGGEQTISDYSGILDLARARERLRADVVDALDLAGPEESALADLAVSWVDANLAYDPGRTAAARDAAAKAMPPVLVRIPQGTLIIEEGQPITAEVAARLEALSASGPGSLQLTEVLGLLIVVALIAFFLYRYTLYHQRHFRKVDHLHALLVIVMLATLLLAQALLWISWGVVDELSFPFNQADLYTYLVPVGAGGILVALLANGRIAMVYSAFTALLFGGLAGWDFYKSVWALLVQWAGVYAISSYRERAALLRAGLIVGGAAAVIAVALEVLQGTADPWPRAAYAMGLAFIGGAVGVGLLISFALPLFESSFNVLTDIRLLELSNVNNPLLSQLAVNAPGSYNHSLVVGTLAEEAAKSIGANSLFCRVAAFYHDIGKLRKPEYYVENMRGSNPHDRLAPSMSALIIASHVKDGIQMAKEAGLPQQIIDIIPQHHGTRLMSFFYNKAKKTVDPALGKVKEEDFRYPGPKPQTKEAAIFMLADGVEAAARTLEEPTSNRLKEVIEKITNAVVLEGQLHECDLTFSDLSKIQQAFLRCLVSFHHQRVDYPGFDFNRLRPGSADAPAAGVGEGGADRGG